MKGKILYIFLFLISVISYGQVNIAADTDKKDLNGKEIINLTIILEINGPELIQESALKLPDLSKFDIIGSASQRNTFLDPRTNTAINQLVYEISLEPKQSGKVKIGSALVQVNGKMYKSEPFDIFVSESLAEKPVSKPSDEVYLDFELQDHEVYQDQPTIAVLRAYSKNFNNLRKVGNVQFPQQQNVNIRPVSFAKSEIEQNSKSKVSSQVIAVVMIFPTAAGKILLKPATVSYKDSGNKTAKLVSNRNKLNVKKLPAGSPENFGNAVGNYDVDISFANKAERLEVNKPINVVVAMSGEGNLNSEQLPKIIETADFKIYKPKFSEKIKSGKHGVKGAIKAHYVLIPKKAGALSVDTQPFSYFDPAQKKYVNLGSKKLALTVMTPEQIADAKSTIERVNEYSNTVLETVTPPIIKTENLKVDPTAKKVVWPTLFSNYAVIFGFSLAMLFLFTTVRKLRSKPAPQQKSMGSVAETEAEIRKKLAVAEYSSFSGLQQQIEREDYQNFFADFEKTVKWFETQSLEKFDKPLNQHIIAVKGAAAEEEYRKIVQQIGIEKYAPVHNQAHLSEILENYRILLEGIV